MIPELLAPAGDWDCVRAAVENGADAVYLGLHDGFNARARAANFDLSEIPELVAWVHRRGVRCYVTLNTLAFTQELPQVESIARGLALAGVDAVLVQDIGAARLIRESCPNLILHASTQMTLTSAECIAAVESLGIARVVLPRELSIDEIRRIHDQTTMPLEVFVHGALCVAYSGQCLTSEALGGRSANRGQCAQACRLPWELVCDGELRDFGDQKYLLSPQDLAAYPLIRQLLEAGVCSFKIEGRLKSAEYVANITQHYRQAVDLAVRGLPAQFSHRQIQQMEQSFSRGFSPGWLNGCDHKMLVPALSSSKRGVLLGEVVAVQRHRVSVRLQYSVAAGDGVAFDGDRAAGTEQGGRVFQVFVNGNPTPDPVESGVVEISFRHHALDPTRIVPGQKVWKTDDPQLNQRLRRSYLAADPQRRVNLTLSVIAESGQPLKVFGSTSTGARCHIVTELPLQPATKHPVTEPWLVRQLGRLGGTIYQLKSLEAKIVNAPMVPLSILGEVRRQIVEQLDSSIPATALPPGDGPVLLRMRNQLPPSGRDSSAHADIRLMVMVRSLDQLHSLITSVQELESGSVPLNVGFCAAADFADLRQYRTALELAAAAGLQLFTATPRIQKPDEMGIFQLLLRQQPHGILVRNLSGLNFFARHGLPILCDFSLNVTNELTAQYLLQQGAGRITASYDLNRDQLLQLVQVIPSSWLQVVIHQRMPMFHMEHCVFCSVLSPGTNKTNCGRPCDVHQVELRDRLGIDHPLTADIGCRNTLFNAVPQSSAEIVGDLLSAGIRHFRIELLRESDAGVRQCVELYSGLLRGAVSGRHVWKALQASNQVGVTRGTLEPRRNPLAIL